MTRIAALACRQLRLRLTRPWGAEVPYQHLVIVEVSTDDGRSGTGFAWTPQIGAGAVLSLLREEIAPAVVDADPTPGPLWDRLWTRLREAGAGGLTTIALAGLDIALWDLRARTAGASLADLLGRRRDRVPVYGSGVNLHYSLDELVAQAERWVAAGHTAAKVKVGKPELDEDVERVAAIRQVLGSRRRLMVDANQRWDLPTARRAIRALERFDLYWVEEPLRADDLAAQADLRTHVDTPLASGENLHTITAFRDALVARALDIAQPNVVRVGGITPFLRIASLASAFAVPVVPHLLPELSGQLALTLPLPPLVEDVEAASFAALGALAAPSGVRIENGELTAATGPGHGLRFIHQPEGS
jgi:L-alanine-DL-glutamate epimerase-like enolase superfamily enzyme